MKKFFGPALALVFFAMLAGTAVTDACVGKSLVIGSVDMPSVNMVSEMMSILITERTGTTVVIKKFPDYRSCYDAAAKGDVDIMVDFTGRGYVDVLKKAPEQDADKVSQTVKEVYEREMNLVWLGQFGFSEPGLPVSGGAKVPEMAAPVIRKETLAKFPALPRVINKLTGKLDNASVDKLVTEIGNGPGAAKKAPKVTRGFLKSKRLI
ncbi:MAG TPA: glycine betaine ABC transporter substrate-binding protein [Nitrospirota bacterium]